MNKIIMISLLLLTSCTVLKKTNKQLDINTQTNIEHNQISSSYLDSLFQNHLEVDIEIIREYFPSSPDLDLKLGPGSTAGDSLSVASTAGDQPGPKSNNKPGLKKEILNIKIKSKTEGRVQKIDSSSTDIKVQGSAIITASEETEIKKTMSWGWINGICFVLIVLLYFAAKKFIKP